MDARGSFELFLRWLPNRRIGTLVVGLVRKISKVTTFVAAASLTGWVFSAPAGQDPITFSDVAARAGVEFVLRNAATGDKHQIETMVSGIAVFDYDNDTWPDLYF